MTEPTIREPEEIRRDCARKLQKNVHGVAEVAELDGDEIG